MKYQDLQRIRPNTMVEMIRPLVPKGEWVGTKPSSSSREVQFTVYGSSDRRLKTTHPDFRAEYYEVWSDSGKKDGNDALWNLDKAYFTLLRVNTSRADYDEIICFHCWEGFEPDATADEKGLKKQRRQEKYQRSIHMHLKFLNLYSKDRDFQFVSKSHLAITLGRQTYEFNSISALTLAMSQAFVLLKEEFLELV